jgi:hypothetical protein
MSKIESKEIINMMEKLEKDQRLVFRLSETFGGRLAVLELNPRYPEKHEKKYLLRLGKDMDQAMRETPFWASDKAKKLGGWVGERSPEMVVEQAPPLKKAG